MKKNEKGVTLQKKKGLACKICYAEASGKHYGVDSCQACKVNI